MDDGLVCASSPHLFEMLTTEIQRHLTKAEIISDASKYIGMEIQYMRDQQMVTLSLRSKIDALTTTGAVVTTAMGSSVNLRRDPPNSDNDSILSEIGKLRFIADHGRWDILLATGEVSKHADHPSDQQCRVLDRIKNYLRSTNDLSLVLGDTDDIELYAYADASSTAEGNSTCRIAGCLFLGRKSGAFDAFSRVCPIVGLASAYDETVATMEVVKRVIYARDILDFLRFTPVGPTRIYVDSRSMIELAKQLKYNAKNAVVNKRLNAIREQINNGLVILYFVKSEDNVADMLTKPLPAEPFLQHRQRILGGVIQQSHLVLLVGRAKLEEWSVHLLGPTVYKGYGVATDHDIAGL